MYQIKDILNTVICGDVLAELKKIPDESIDTICTSPPYWGLRDYGVKGQLGLEPTLEEYLEKLLKITAELKRVLKKTGVMFWNHGDCYGSKPPGNSPENIKEWAEKGDGLIGRKFERYGSFKKSQRIQPKCLALQNWRLILKMIDEQGWILRNSIVWHKSNAMPSSVKDRFANKYENVFMLVKNKKYYFDLNAVRIPSTTFENRPYGVIREREFGYNTGFLKARKPFNYRVRDAEKKSEQCPQFKATKEEIERYKKETGKIKGGGANLNLPWNPLTGGKIYKTSIPQSQAESFGSPRARYWREEEKKGIKIMGFKDPHRSALIGGLASGNVKNNPLGKNPGDIIQIPLDWPTGLLTREEAAYIAGILDGEGCISLQEKRTNDVLFITIVNTHQSVIEWLKNKLGVGRIYNRKRDEKWRKTWEFNLYGNNAASLIYAIYPWLIIKKEQAKTALEFQSLGVSVGQQIEEWAKQRRKELIEEMHQLNHYQIFKSSSPDPVEKEYNFNGDIFTIPTQPCPREFRGVHFATFPEKLVEPMILAGCPKDGIVLDPFCGLGTVGVVAKKLKRNFIGIDIKEEYCEMARQRIRNTPEPLF